MHYFLAYIFTTFIFLVQELLADPLRMGQHVFGYGQQHDCHELVLLLLQDMAKKGLFEPISTQMEKKCLGNVCGTKNTVRPTCKCFFFQSSLSQHRSKYPLENFYFILLPHWLHLHAVLYAYCILAMSKYF